MLKVLAPAKINLTLEVLGKRPDGFHEIRSVLQTLNLCDCLRFQTGQGITLKSDLPGWSADESLIAKAVSLLQEATGCSQGAAMRVEKHIPLVSGLGGDSSDAAATLRGLNELWGLGLSPERLLDLAVQLGSDVAFFLYGGTALVESRGEVVKTLPPLSPRWVVLVVPDVPRLPGKTKKLYSSLKKNHYTDGKITEKLVTVLNKGDKFEPSLLFNTFENVMFEGYTTSVLYMEHIIKLGAPHVHLAGSGPTLFTMFGDKTQAEDLYTRCKDQGMEAHLAGTSGSIKEESL